MNKKNNKSKGKMKIKGELIIDEKGARLEFAVIPGIAWHIYPLDTDVALDLLPLLEKDLDWLSKVIERRIKREKAIKRLIKKTIRDTGII